MGVARYQLSPALPQQLRPDLPTIEELAREFPLMSVVKLRIEIERALRDFMVKNDIPIGRSGIGNMLRELHRRDLGPASTAKFLDALRVMNAASHGIDVDEVGAQQAVDIGSVFLSELRQLGAAGADVPE